MQQQVFTVHSWFVIFLSLCLPNRLLYHLLSHCLAHHSLLARLRPTLCLSLRTVTLITQLTYRHSPRILPYNNSYRSMLLPLYAVFRGGLQSCGKQSIGEADKTAYSTEF